MRRYLVVANQTLGGDHLAEAVRERLGAGDCRFHVLVPASPAQGTVTWTEGEALALARERLEKALARFTELGADATGDVGDADPVEAIRDTLARETFDEVILSTLPAGMSRWLKLDLPHRVHKAFSVPVVHVVARAEAG